MYMTQSTHQLIEGDVRSSTRIHEPPRSRGNSGKTDVTTNDKVSEEQPARDEGVLDVTRRLVHDVNVRRVEAKGSGRETVGDQVDPEKLDRNESFREAKSSSQEDTERRGGGRRDTGGMQVKMNVPKSLVDLCSKQN